MSSVSSYLLFFIYPSIIFFSLFRFNNRSMLMTVINPKLVLRTSRPDEKYFPYDALVKFVNPKQKERV